MAVLQVASILPVAMNSCSVPGTFRRGCGPNYDPASTNLTGLRSSSRTDIDAIFGGCIQAKIRVSICAILACRSEGMTLSRATGLKSLSLAAGLFSFAGVGKRWRYETRQK